MWEWMVTHQQGDAGYEFEAVQKSVEIIRDARHCTLITRVLGPPATWEDAAALLLLPHQVPPSQALIWGSQMLGFLTPNP